MKINRFMSRRAARTRCYTVDANENFERTINFWHPLVCNLVPDQNNHHEYELFSKLNHKIDFMSESSFIILNND